MVDTVLSPPLLPGHRYPMSREEYLALAEMEGLRIEWVNGEAIVLMPALPRHLRLTSFLVRLIGGFLDLYDLGEIFSDHLGVAIPTRPATRLPDVVVVLKEHATWVERGGLSGPADLIIEIVSRDSVVRDREDKLREYEAAGAREYLWIESREGLTGYGYYRLDPRGRYQPVTPDSSNRCHSVAIPGFWFDPLWFEQDPLPNPKNLLRLIAPDA